MTLSEHSENKPGTRTKLKRSMWSLYVVTFGIVLPVVTLFVELAWAWCAQVFFDPIPNLLHVAMIAIVPVANLLALLLRQGHFAGSAGRIRFVNGIAIGISAFYTILFIPIMPIAALALIGLIGLMPLAPLLSLIAAIMCRRVIPKPKITDPVAPLAIASRGRPFNSANWGIVAGLIIIIAAELPFALTEIGLRMAASQNTEESLRGINLLRNFSDSDRLLSYSYDRRGRPKDIISLFLSWDRTPLSVDDARKVYYRVTGQAFNDLEPVSNRRHGLWGNDGWFDFDIDQGGDVVGKRLQDVQLSSSLIDGSIDADAAIAYLQWTFEFSNQSPRLAEARAQLQLPPGAVVSRVTLWINGEEREAAFGGRGQARQAYQRVVQRQRDPILVTTAGSDTVLVQLYPIPVSGKMKARIGISAPLLLKDASQAILRLPHFKQRNFAIAPDFEHSLWIESAATMQDEPAHLIFESASSGASTLRGKLDDAALKSPHHSIRVARNSQITRSYAIDNRAKAKPAVIQRIIRRDVKLARLVIVIDGSKSMQHAINEVADVITRLPQSMGISIIIAGDQIVELNLRMQPGNKSSYTHLAQQLRDYNFNGGVDNSEALEKAWSMAATQPGAAVLWIHGPQPIILNSVASLQQNWRRRPQGPILYDFPLTSQVNRIAEALDGISQFKLLPRISNLQQDLSHQFDLWSGTRSQLIAIRQQASAEMQNLPKNLTSDHLVRLWANDRVHALIADSASNRNKQATEMAARYQLVTPVSGAVVLESQQQYDDNGLQPVPEGSVPTIPEPETWLLIITTICILSWVIYRRRRVDISERFLA